MSIQDRIQEPNDIKKIDEKDLPELAQDIREFLIANVSETGGHLIFSSGQDLMHIGLMSYIPYQLISREIHRTMKCDRKFHAPKV